MPTITTCLIVTGTLAWLVRLAARAELATATDAAHIVAQTRAAQTSAFQGITAQGTRRAFVTIATVSACPGQPAQPTRTGGRIPSIGIFSMIMGQKVCDSNINDP
jgi:hypothetical protein